MPQRSIIQANNLNINPVDAWLNHWYALTAGTMGASNSMTIAWGSLGGMWARPFLQVVVRPCRHTYGFMEANDNFTVSGFGPQHKKDLQTLGSTSGREGDKISQTSLTLCKSHLVEAPCFEQAELVFECKKVYFQDMDSANFLDKDTDKHYPKKDYHRIYFGEILGVYGIDKYNKAPA
jgi:flavin reductase (DIM6/NTAB) family NADH-FMN oxidoreductase RutF